MISKQARIDFAEYGELVYLTLLLGLFTDPDQTPDEIDTLIDYANPVVYVSYTVFAKTKYCQRTRRWNLAYSKKNEPFSVWQMKRFDNLACQYDRIPPELCDVVTGRPPCFTELLHHRQMLFEITINNIK